MFYILEHMFVFSKRHSIWLSAHVWGFEQDSNRAWLSMRSHLLQKGYHGDAARKVRGGGMAEEHLTADLLKQLSAAARPEDYLLQGETIDRELSDYLNELRNDRGMKRAAVVRESAVNETFVYDISKGRAFPVATMLSSLHLPCAAASLKRSGFCGSRAFQSFGPNARETRSLSGASNAASRWRSAMTSSIAWVSKRW